MYYRDCEWGKLNVIKRPSLLIKTSIMLNFKYNKSELLPKNRHILDCIEDHCNGYELIVHTILLNDWKNKWTVEILPSNFFEQRMIKNTVKELEGLLKEWFINK